MCTSQKPASSIVDDELVKEIECEDGYPLRYRVWLERGPARATLVLLNGIMSHSEWFRELATFLAAQHLHVVGADRRGSGLNQKDRGDLPAANLLLSDLQRVVDREVTGQLFLLGWCWGAVLALNAAPAFGSALKGVVLLAPGLLPSTEVRSVMKGAVKHAGGKLPLIGNPLIEEMFTDRVEVREWIKNDGLALRAFTPRLLDVSQAMLLSANARLSKVSHPILLLLAAHDRMVNNEATLNAFKKLWSGDVTCMRLPYNHAMQLEASTELASNIVQWLIQQKVPLPASPR
jgi:acylglycerol lipase